MCFTPEFQTRKYFYIIHTSIQQMFTQFFLFKTLWFTISLVVWLHTLQNFSTTHTEHLLPSRTVQGPSIPVLLLPFPIHGKFSTHWVPTMSRCYTGNRNKSEIKRQKFLPSGPERQCRDKGTFLTCMHSILVQIPWHHVQSFKHHQE